MRLLEAPLLMHLAWQEHASALLREHLLHVMEHDPDAMARHAQASEVTVELRCEDHSLHLVVHDDGRGFDVPACLARTGPGASLGLIGMQERVSLLGGRFECRSSPALGTEVHAWLPLIWHAAPPILPRS